MEIFCNIINVFIITFDQFKAFLAYLLNNSMHFYNPPQIYWLQGFEWYRAVLLKVWNSIRTPFQISRALIIFPTLIHAF